MLFFKHFKGADFNALLALKCWFLIFKKKKKIQIIRKKPPSFDTLSLIPKDSVMPKNLS